MGARVRTAATITFLTAAVALVGAGAVGAQVPNRPPKIVLAPTILSQTTAAPSTLPPVREPGVVRVMATCPAGERHANLQPGTPAFNEIVGAQSRLGRTIEQLRRYATTQAKSFGDLRFGGKNNGTVVISFTGDLQIHAEALTKITDIPNGVVVCPAVETAATRVALAKELVARLQGALVGGSLTPVSGPPVVVLRADRRAVADDLVRTYGSRVQVVLGEFVYPDATVARHDTSTPRRSCGSVPIPGPSASALRWSVAKPVKVHSGGDISTVVSWRNTKRQTITYESGDPITGVVTAVGSNRVLAFYGGAIAGVGHGAALQPGQTDQVRGLVATASCDISFGYALAPGRYTVRFVFGGFDFSANGGLKVERFVSNPIPLTITNDPPPPLPKLSPASPITLLPGAGGGGPGATIAAGPITPKGAP